MTTDITDPPDPGAGELDRIDSTRGEILRPVFFRVVVVALLAILAGFQAGTWFEIRFANNVTQDQSCFYLRLDEDGGPAKSLDTLGQEMNDIYDCDDLDLPLDSSDPNTE